MTQFLQTAWKAFVNSGRGLSEQELAELGQTLEQYSDKLDSYVRLLMQWNQKMDLISPAPLAVVYERHIIDSAVSWKLLARELKNVSRETLELSWLDIGSGAGLPGIVFAILSPDQKVTLLEPRGKRVQFLTEVRRQLKLTNIEIVESRLEALSGEGLYGVAISRAIKIEGKLATALTKLVVPGGVYAQLAGEEPEKTEISGFLSSESQSYALPGDTSGRNLVIYKCFT